MHTPYHNWLRLVANSKTRIFDFLRRYSVRQSGSRHDTEQQNKLK